MRSTERVAQSSYKKMYFNSWFSAAQSFRHINETQDVGLSLLKEKKVKVASRNASALFWYTTAADQVQILMPAAQSFQFIS